MLEKFVTNILNMVLYLRCGVPEFKSSSDHQLNLFYWVILGSNNCYLYLSIANWSVLLAFLDP